MSRPLSAHAHAPHVGVDVVRVGPRHVPSATNTWVSRTVLNRFSCGSRDLNRDCMLALDADR